MRSTMISAAVIAFVVNACGDDGPLPISGPSQIAPLAVSLASEGKLPMTGGCVTKFPPPPFPLPPSINQIDTGTCQLSHLGRAEFRADQVINFANGTATSSDVSFSAPNGDVLLATSLGTFVPSGSGASLSAVLTFTGGSGRFANASGEITVEGQVDFATSTTRFKLVDGWLSVQ